MKTAFLLLLSAAVLLLSCSPGALAVTRIEFSASLMQSFTSCRNNSVVFVGWMQAEGSPCGWNPLDSTQPANGATNCNAVGVKNYPDEVSGVKATVATLNNGYYPEIVGHLKACSDPITTARAIASSRWGTGQLAVECITDAAGSDSIYHAYGDKSVPLQDVQSCLQHFKASARAVLGDNNEQQQQLEKPQQALDPKLMLGLIAATHRPSQAQKRLNAAMYSNDHYRTLGTASTSDQSVISDAAYFVKYASAAYGWVGLLRNFQLGRSQTDTVRAAAFDAWRQKNMQKQDEPVDAHEQVIVGEAADRKALEVFLDITVAVRGKASRISTPTGAIAAVATTASFSSSAPSVVDSSPSASDHPEEARVELVAEQWSSSEFDCAYFLAVDHRKQCLVLCIRGTNNLQDALTDLVCGCAELEIGGVRGFAHQGIKRCAETLIGKVRDVLIAELARWPQYPLIITGHSLGAGTAHLVTMMLHQEKDQDPRLAQAVCFAFAPPPVTSEEFASSYDDSIYSFVCFHDIVPRLSMRNALNTLARAECAVTVMPKPLRDTARSYIDSKARGALGDEFVDWFIAEDQLLPKEWDDALDATDTAKIAKQVPQLYVAGSVLFTYDLSATRVVLSPVDGATAEAQQWRRHLQRMLSVKKTSSKADQQDPADADADADDADADEDDEDMKITGDFGAFWIPRSEIAELALHANNVADHNPRRYQDAMEHLAGHQTSSSDSVSLMEWSGVLARRAGGLALLGLYWTATVPAARVKDAVASSWPFKRTNADLP